MSRNAHIYIFVYACIFMRICSTIRTRMSAWISIGLPVFCSSLDLGSGGGTHIALMIQFVLICSPHRLAASATRDTRSSPRALRARSPTFFHHCELLLIALPLLGPLQLHQDLALGPLRLLEQLFDGCAPQKRGQSALWTPKAYVVRVHRDHCRRCLRCKIC